MKKLLTLIAVLFITAPAFAQETINVNVKKDDSYSDAIKARAAVTAANAAVAAAMSDPSSSIKTPLEVDLNNFTTIALIGVNLTGACTTPVEWAMYRCSFKRFKQLLSFSPLTVLNPIEENKKKYKKNRFFLRDIKDPNWLYVYYKESKQGVDDARSLVIRDSKNKVLYSATHINVAQAEVVSFLTDF